jgi:hypothetical protein
VRASAGVAHCTCGEPKIDFVVGAGVVGEPGAYDCEQPSLLIYACCGICRAVPCGSTKTAWCKPCARRYRGRVCTVAEVGLMRVRSKQAFVLTLTAPTGKPHCKRRDHPRCDGRGAACKPCECTIANFDVGTWNAQHTSRKNDFITALRRGEASSLQHGKRRHLQIEYFGGIEAQDGKRRPDGVGRYALHDHLICVAERDITFSLSAVRKLAVDHGYGHELHLDVLPVDGSKFGKVAAYCGKIASYVGKACDERAVVPWRASGEDPHKGRAWRAWTRSRGWGCSMAEVSRHRKRHLTASTASALPVRTAEGSALDVLLASYADGRAPPSNDTAENASQRWCQTVQLALFMPEQLEVKRHGRSETETRARGRRSKRRCSTTAR